MSLSAGVHCRNKRQPQPWRSRRRKCQTTTADHANKSHTRHEMVAKASRNGVPGKGTAPPASLAMGSGRCNGIGLESSPSTSDGCDIAGGLTGLLAAQDGNGTAKLQKGINRSLMATICHSQYRTTGEDRRRNQAIRAANATNTPTARGWLPSHKPSFSPLVESQDCREHGRRRFCLFLVAAVQSYGRLLAGP